VYKGALFSNYSHDLNSDLTRSCTMTYFCFLLGDSVMQALLKCVALVIISSSLHGRATSRDYLVPSNRDFYFLWIANSDYARID
jgi:predicted LPLAT superfamily acyltransferase